MDFFIFLIIINEIFIYIMKIKFSNIVSLIALTIAGIAGYFSIVGLSEIFAGSTIAVIIMASILEIGKVVTTTLLQRYWGVIGKAIRIYLTMVVFILMVITSGGIYGFLSNAYQKTANKLELYDGELSVIDSKIKSYEDTKNQKSNRREQLINLREKQEVRIDSAKTNKSKIRVEKSIEDANNEINKLDKDIDILNDSINSYNTKVLTIKSGSEVASEIGPLKYLSELTGQPMGSVVNWFILLLIFVFDPLAVMLIIAANKIMILEDKKEEPINTIIEKEVPVEVIVEVIKEVPVDVIIEKEIIKEIPVDVIVEKEVIKEVEVEKVVTNIEYISDETEINRLNEIVESLTNELEKEKKNIKTIEVEKIIEIPTYMIEDVIVSGSEMDIFEDIKQEEVKQEEVKIVEKKYINKKSKRSDIGRIN